MADYRLSKTQRNELFQIAVNLGLDPAAFSWIDDHHVDGDIFHRIVHTPSGSFIRMDRESMYVSAYFHFPDYQPRTVDLDTAKDTDWPALSLQIGRWFQAVKEESDAPDLWQLARDERAWLTSTETDFGGNTPFTPIEQDQIARSLKTIEEFTIRTYQLTAAHEAHVRGQLAYLVDAARRVGRFDWKNLAAATFIDIVLALGLDPQKAQKLLALATQLLGPLVMGVARLIGP